MFSSHKHLKRKTPDGGIDRREYIGHLVDEYYTSTNVEALEQVTANLANFAYDPINWPHLHAADALDVFVSALETQNPNLQLHAVAALCNFSLDSKATQFMLQNIDVIRDLFLRTEHTEIVLHSVALYHQLLSGELATKQSLITPTLLQRLQHWRQTTKDARIVKLCQVFLEDFGSRIEVTELQNAAATTTAEQSNCSKAATGSSDKTLHPTGS